MALVQPETYVSTARWDNDTLYCKRVRNVNGIESTTKKFKEWLMQIAIWLRKETEWGSVEVVIPRERQDDEYASLYAFARFENTQLHHEVISMVHNRYMFIDMYVEIGYKKIPGMFIPVQMPIDIVKEREESGKTIDRYREPQDSRGRAITSDEGRLIRVRNDALMAQTNELLIENRKVKEEVEQKDRIIAELKAELQRKDTIIQELEKKTSTRKKVAERLEEQQVNRSSS